jgi:hypothetical protein
VLDVESPSRTRRSGIDRIAPDLSPLRRPDRRGSPDAATRITSARFLSAGVVPGARLRAAVHPRFARKAARGGRSPGGAFVGRGAASHSDETSPSGFRVSHSVPDSRRSRRGGRLETLPSGDFKLDPDPPDGETTDIEAISGDSGRRPRARRLDQRQRPGRALSEGRGGSLAAAFAGRPAASSSTFSSHVCASPRAAAAIGSGRRVAMLGRSMRTVAEIAERFGRLRLPTPRESRRATLARVSGARAVPGVGKPGGSPRSTASRSESADLR